MSEPGGQERRKSGRDAHCNYRGGNRWQCGRSRLAVLADADETERAILGSIGYVTNRIYLHRDVRLMPRRRQAWASWNLLKWPRSRAAGNDVAVTYWMNILQGIDNDKPLFVSLNPPLEPDPQLTFGTYSADHPQFTAFAAQKQLGETQGRRHSWFCGAWTGYGFHEDGLRSGGHGCGVKSASRQECAKAITSRGKLSYFDRL